MRRISLLPILILTACMVEFEDLDEPSGAQDSSISGDNAEDSGEGSEVPETLVKAMDVVRLVGHLEALQEIADLNSDTRVTGTSGFDQSADYVAGQLEDAGFEVTWQDFEHAVWTVLGEAVLETDDGSTWEENTDFVVMSYSPGGVVTGPLAVVDVDIPPTGGQNSSDSGCEVSDFDGMAAGSIALIQRGACTFETKAFNAQGAGAVGVIIFNEGQSDRQDVVQGTLGEGTGLEIPVLGASYALGTELAGAADSGTVWVNIAAEVLNDVLPTWNLFADLAGETDQILIMGAHLDSVSAGPGINDNGSGTAMVLELAIQSAAMGHKPSNTLRFAFWGAEESGLIGSVHYVEELSESDWARHLANLNFDMVASPNGARFVYDGDGSLGGGYPAPQGSTEIETLFTDFLDSKGLDWSGTSFDGRSDYGPFIWTGIPAGGLFTGAEGSSGDGEAYDSCYHQACDTIDNIDRQLFLEMAQAGAHVTEVLGNTGILAESAAMVPSPRDLGFDLPEHHARGAGCEPTALR